MTDLRTAAQAVIARYDNALEIDTHCDLADPIEALRQALASGPSVDILIARAVEQAISKERDEVARFEIIKRIVDSAPPSLDALIAEAVAKEREECAQLCIQMGTEPMEWQPSKLGIRPEHWDVAQAIRARGQK